MALLYCMLLIISTIPPPHKNASKLQAPKTEIKHSKL